MPQKSEYRLDASGSALKRALRSQGKLLERALSAELTKAQRSFEKRLSLARQREEERAQQASVLYACGRCQKLFDSQQTLLAHIERRHTLVSSDTMAKGESITNKFNNLSLATELGQLQWKMSESSKEIERLKAQLSSATPQSTSAPTTSRSNVSDPRTDSYGYKSAPDSVSFNNESGTTPLQREIARVRSAAAGVDIDSLSHAGGPGREQILLDLTAASRNAVSTLHARIADLERKLTQQSTPILEPAPAGARLGAAATAASSPAAATPVPLTAALRQQDGSETLELKARVRQLSKALGESRAAHQEAAKHIPVHRTMTLGEVAVSVADQLGLTSEQVGLALCSSQHTLPAAQRTAAAHELTVEQAELFTHRPVLLPHRRSAAPLSGHTADITVASSPRLATALPPPTPRISPPLRKSGVMAVHPRSPAVGATAVKSPARPPSAFGSRPATSERAKRTEREDASQADSGEQPAEETTSVHRRDRSFAGSSATPRDRPRTAERPKSAGSQQNEAPVASPSAHRRERSFGGSKTPTTTAKPAVAMSRGRQAERISDAALEGSKGAAAMLQRQIAGEAGAVSTGDSSSSTDKSSGAAVMPPAGLLQPDTSASPEIVRPHKVAALRRSISATSSARSASGTGTPSSRRLSSRAFATTATVTSASVHFSSLTDDARALPSNTGDDASASQPSPLTNNDVIGSSSASEGSASAQDTNGCALALHEQQDDETVPDAHSGGGNDVTGYPPLAAGGNGDVTLSPASPASIGRSPVSRGRHSEGSPHSLSSDSPRQQQPQVTFHNSSGTSGGGLLHSSAGPSPSSSHMLDRAITEISALMESIDGLEGMMEEAEQESPEEGEAEIDGLGAEGQIGARVVTGAGHVEIGAEDDEDQWLAPEERQGAAMTNIGGAGSADSRTSAASAESANCKDDAAEGSEDFDDRPAMGGPFAFSSSFLGGSSAAQSTLAPNTRTFLGHRDVSAPEAEPVPARPKTARKEI